MGSVACADTRRLKRWCLRTHQTISSAGSLKRRYAQRNKMPRLRPHDLILSMSCLDMIHTVWSLLKAEDINHKIIGRWHFDLLSCMRRSQWDGFSRGGGHMRCYQSIWLSAFVPRRIITRCSANVNVPQRCLKHLLEGCPLKSRRCMAGIWIS